MKKKRMKLNESKFTDQEKKSAVRSSLSITSLMTVDILMPECLI